LLIGSNYVFDLYKSKDKENPKVEIGTVYLVSDEHAKSLQTIADNATIIGENVNFARNLVNENADIATSLLLAKVGKEIAAKYKFSCKIFDEKDMKKMGMGLLLAVSRGAEHPPRLVVMEYKGDPKSKDVTCIVGKGITFDTGGLNLKPTNYIEDMKGDMSASAVCLATIKSAAQLGLKINLTSVIPVCENAIGPKSYHPGDVFTAYNGKTVQIENTDAEGRLILGDALSYVAKHIKPTRLIDLATLTGSVLITFGEYVIGMVSNDDKMSSQMFEAGERTYERVWRIPLYDEYKEQIKGDFADIKNSGYNNGRYAGTITAAAFLSEFVECKKWIHLDIAGMSLLDNPINYLPKGGTGVGVRLLLDFLEK
jgi:leucyl aminopeptidase